MSQAAAFVSRVFSRIFWPAIAVAWMGILAARGLFGPIRWDLMAIDTGWLAWYLMAYTVLVGLLARAWTNRWTGMLLAKRRAAGIMAVLIVMSHAAAQLLRLGLLDGQSLGQSLTAAFSPATAHLLGVLAFLLLLPALASSSAWATRQLGYRAWKFLHRLIHIAFVLIGFHVGLRFWITGGAVDWRPLIVLCLYLIGYVALNAYLYASGRARRSAVPPGPELASQPPSAPAEPTGPGHRPDGPVAGLEDGRPRQPAQPHDS